MKTVNSIEQHHDHETEYDAFIVEMGQRFDALTGPIFETSATGLYEAYLAQFRADNGERQYHTCNFCRNFIERFGHLVYVHDDGTLQSAIWHEADAPANYQRAVAEMARQVRRAKITMPFLSSETMYGTPVSGTRKDGSGEWHHFGIAPAAARIYKPTPLKNAFQAASEKREEFGSVARALFDYTKDTVATALNLLKNDQLGNSAAAVAQAQFLFDLHTIEARGELRANLIRRAVALAPAGFCHPRSSMIATLLDDIKAGKSFEQARAAWNAKMHPLAYQRPQAAPTSGAIKAAEEAFEKMGAATALRRRYATLDDVLEKLWEPKTVPIKENAARIFASVKTKNEQTKAATMRAPATTMTWDKFTRTILPTADSIAVFVPEGAQSFIALTAAVDPEAVPLLQWDSASRRNTVSAYLYHGGSRAQTWNLPANQWHAANAVTLRPSMWFGGVGFEHQPQGAVLILDGCRDVKGGVSSALFPSTIRADYRAYISVIEAFSNTNNLESEAQASACGLLIAKEGNRPTLLRVTSAGQTNDYKIDRWD